MSVEYQKPKKVGFRKAKVVSRDHFIKERERKRESVHTELERKGNQEDFSRIIET